MGVDKRNAKTELPSLPVQAGWAVMMHGGAVLFATNAEKAYGLSPGAEEPLYTATQMYAYAARAIATEGGRMIDYQDFETAEEIDEACSYVGQILAKDIICIETMLTGFFRVWYRN